MHLQSQVEQSMCQEVEALGGCVIVIKVIVCGWPLLFTFLDNSLTANQDIYIHIYIYIYI
jgi:hypothetical protein